jgi:hypothetical protein
MILLLSVLGMTWIPSYAGFGDAHLLDLNLAVQGHLWAELLHSTSRRPEGWIMVGADSSMKPMELRELGL